MRISDWSSDVCSSDLAKPVERDHIVRIDLRGARERTDRRIALLGLGVEDAEIGPRTGVLRKVLGQLGERLLRRIGIAILHLRQRGVEACLRIAMIGRLDRRRSEEHTSELQSLMRISYAIFCLKKK